MNTLPFPDDERLDAELDALLALPLAERQQRLIGLGQQEPELASRVKRILAAEDDHWLEGIVGGVAEALVDDHVGLPSGTRLGPWEIEQSLGEGGMGRVYRGRRADGAFVMPVAIKVLRRELALPAQIFQHERNLLARLDHPALTRLLDGGVSDSGDAYLVMECIDGIPLEDWLQQKQPDWPSRLALFQVVADAVAHAHRQRVIHGDIKPANIHVDSEDRPRLLDFGIAQLVEASESVPELLRQAMTPAYAAPERLAGEPASVQTDIHALGLLLQWLVEPSAQNRMSLPRRGDMDAILAKATHQEPCQRYGSVSALLEDIQRWQRGQPVLAVHGGLLYVWKRFVVRHRVGMAIGAMALLALLAGSAALLWQNRVIRGERDQARIAEARADTVLDYLVGVMGRVGRDGGTQSISLEEALAADLANIDRDFAGDGPARQSLLSRLAELHVRMQDHATATRLLEKIGELDEDATPPLVRVRTLDNRAQIALQKGELEAAAELEQAAFALLEQQSGDHRGQVSQLLVSRAQIESRAGKQAEAVATLQRALALRLQVSSPESAQTVVVRNGLAVTLMRSGAYTEALTEFRALTHALETSQREHSLDAANIYNNYAATAFVVGLFDEAAPQFVRALQLQEQRFGASASLAALLSNYARLLLMRGELEQSEAMVQRAETMMQQYGSDTGVDLQLIRFSRAVVLAASGDSDGALQRHAEVARELAQRLGDSHPLALRVKASALGIEADARRIESASADFDVLLEALATVGLQREQAELACQRSRLALLQADIGRAEHAAMLCVEAWGPSQVENSPRLAYAHFLLAESRWRKTAQRSWREQRDQALVKAVSLLPTTVFPYDQLAELTSH